MVIAVLGCASVRDNFNFTAVFFAFIFQIKSRSALSFAPDDIRISFMALTVSPRKIKGTELHPPLILRKPETAVWSAMNPVTPLSKWDAFCPRIAGLSDMILSTELGSAGRAASLHRFLVHSGESAPQSCFYGSHSPRIGGFNELFVPSFTLSWVLHCLDWTSDHIAFAAT